MHTNKNLKLFKLDFADERKFRPIKPTDYLTLGATILAKILLAWFIVSFLVIIVHGVIAVSDAKTTVSGIKTDDTVKIDSGFQGIKKEASSIFSEFNNPIWSVFNAVTINNFSNLQKFTKIGNQMLNNIDDNPQFLSNVLGFNKPMRYLLLFQQNAQVKSLGGSPSQSVSIIIDKGHFEIEDKLNSGSYGAYTGNTSYRAIPDTDDFFKQFKGSYPANEGGEKTGSSAFYSIYPLHTFRSVLSQTQYMDFSVDARVAKQIYEARFCDMAMEQSWYNDWSGYKGINSDYKYYETCKTNKPVDAVMTFDPVSLGILLKATPSLKVTLENPTEETTITPKNAASLVSNGIYWRHPEEVQSSGNPKGDKDFDILKDAIFDAIQHHLNPVKAIGPIADIVNERRLLVWFNDASNNKVVQGDGEITKVSGKIPNDKGETVIGGYVNDVEPSKVDYYVDFSINVKRSLCLTQNATYYDVVMGQKTTKDLYKNFEMIKKLPQYIHGGTNGSTTIRTDFYVVSPQNAEFLGYQPLDEDAKNYRAEPISQSGLFKSGVDANLGNRFVARTAAYTQFAENNHEFLFKKDGLDFKKLNIITTPSFNKFKVKKSTGIGCPKPSQKMTTANAGNIVAGSTQATTSTSSATDSNDNTNQTNK